MKYIIILIIISGCVKDKTPPAASAHPARQRPAAARAAGCRGCHPDISTHHAACTACHRGDNSAADRKAAHAGLIPAPAHPDTMDQACGPCHEQEVASVRACAHFTLAGEANTVRAAFGATTPLPSAFEIPRVGVPATGLQLADDLLRRRCLDCHVAYGGDNYPGRRHGQGCAACHLAFTNGKADGHVFRARPADAQCLSCHTANHVGADYYGWFEQDYNWEYRVPFGSQNAEEPPAGTGIHQLAPDVHKQAGMQCIDCHTGAELMAGEPGIGCRNCHDPAAAPPPTVSVKNGRRLLRTRSGDRVLAIPLMRDPAHADTALVACAVCHAQWTFADRSTHLLRTDEPEYDEWAALTRQGSFEVEYYLNQALFEDNGEALAVMQDKLDGAIRPGIWLTTYSLRRWEEIPLCRAPNGELSVCRAIANLFLSYVNADGETVFDEIGPDPAFSLLPYTPHTIGKAGAFYRQRLARAPGEKRP